MAKPREVTPPPDSAIAPLYADADLADAYAILLPEGASGDVETLARAMFSRTPWWVTPLMATRDAVMGRLGVKTSGTIGREAAASKAGAVGFFPVKERHAREIVLGEDDRHLDFRASVMVRNVAGGRELVTTTVVHCRNRVGRVYLTVIAPFHRAVVKGYLAGMNIETGVTPNVRIWVISR